MEDHSYLYLNPNPKIMHVEKNDEPVFSFMPKGYITTDFPFTDFDISVNDFRLWLTTINQQPSYFDKIVELRSIDKRVNKKIHILKKGLIASIKPHGLCCAKSYTD